MGSLLESINKMFRFPSLVIILQATNIIANHAESDIEILVSQLRLSSLNHEGGIANAVDDKTSRSYQKEPLQNIYIPRPILLNERIRNPKFISKHPKRKKASNGDKPVTISKTRNMKNKKPVTSAPHANILNTNFKYVFLARMKNKDRIEKKKHLQTVLAHKLSNSQQDFARPLDVRLGLRTTRKKKILKRRKKKNK